MRLLCRYITRPALESGRAQCNAAQVALKLKIAWRDGITYIVMSPLFKQRCRSRGCTHGVVEHCQAECYGGDAGA
ncbi:MAG: hypothetical protein ABI343_12495 [Burkholderiaceae bacterium]